MTKKNKNVVGSSSMRKKYPTHIFIEDKKEKDTDSIAGDHIVELINFAKAE